MIALQADIWCLSCKRARHLLSSIKVVSSFKLMDNKSRIPDLTLGKWVHSLHKLKSLIRSDRYCEVPRRGCAEQTAWFLDTCADLREGLLGFPHSCLQFLGPSYRLQIFHSMSHPCRWHFLGSWCQPWLMLNSPLLGLQNKSSAMIIASVGLLAPWFVLYSHSSHTHYSVISLPCTYKGSDSLLMGCKVKQCHNFQ